MAAQNGCGEVVLGDSHEYGADVSPFDKICIDDVILAELRRMMNLPDWTIAERWHGVYPQIPGNIEYVREAEPGVTIAIASGGCGMTMSFGLADTLWASASESQRAARDASQASEALQSIAKAASLSSN